MKELTKKDATTYVETAIIIVSIYVHSNEAIKERQQLLIIHDYSQEILIIFFTFDFFDSDDNQAIKEIVIHDHVLEMIC